MATTMPTLDPATLHRRWGLALAVGVVMVVLGTLGLGAAGLLTLASVVFFGWLLILHVMSGPIKNHQAGVGYPGSQLCLVFGRELEIFTSRQDQRGYFDLVEAVHDRPTLEKMGCAVDQGFGSQLRL